MYFKDVVGQQALKERLIANIIAGRVSHAQLFLGQEGSGKLTLALAYARYLTCTNPQPDDACGTCPSCLKFNKLAHPDVNFFFPTPSKKQGEKVFISKDYMVQWRSFLAQSAYVSLNSWYAHIEVENKQGIINAEDCNEINRVLSYKSYESEYKIVVIWMIERLYHSAAPKLLKILEEPPEKTLFLIIAENQDLILNTILSRTQIIKIPRLPDDEIARGLIQLYKIDEKVAREAAFISDGSFFKALDVSRQSDDSTGYVNFIRLWLRHCYKFNLPEVLNAVEEFAKMGREKQKTLLSFGLELFHKSNLVNYHTQQLVKANTDTMDFVTKFASVLKPIIIKDVCNLFSDAIYHIERNANPKILLTDMSLQLAMIFAKAK